MMHTGELISLSVAISWTACAIFAEVAGKRLGSLALNVIRMAMSLAMLIIVMLCATGHPYPVGADRATWGWLLLSGLVGYVLGDFCLFNCYILIGSRYGQLLMTLAPAAAAVAGNIILGQRMAPAAIAGMLVTMTGIAISIYRRPDGGSGGYDPDSMRNIIPFASTSIRAVMGLIGFSLWTLLSGHGADLTKGIRDRRGMLSALGATITGPFIGVSLSLMATLYTKVGIAQTIMALTPVLIIVPTWLIFKQKITLREIIGAIVAVFGVSLFFLF